MSAPARIAVQPHRRVVRGEVCPETSAGWAHQAEWPGRSGQLTEVEVSRLEIGGDQGRLGVSASVANACRGRLGGLPAGGGGLKPLCMARWRS